MPRTYSAFVINSVCVFRSLLCHLPLFHCQQSKKFKRILHLHFLILQKNASGSFELLQTFVQSHCSRRSTSRKERKCKIMSSGHLCCLQSSLLAQMGKYLALLAVAEHPMQSGKRSNLAWQSTGSRTVVLKKRVHPGEQVLLCFT